MANIADKVAQIRQAIFGKDVRENIASGIEAINSEVVSTTARQKVIDGQEATRQSNENTRQSQETTRVNNETERDAVIAQFKAWYNSSSLTGRLPFVIDGGNFGDSRTGATYDGGNFGDPR